jgi:hypothetical protein
MQTMAIYRTHLTGTGAKMRITLQKVREEVYSLPKQQLCVMQFADYSQRPIRMLAGYVNDKQQQQQLLVAVTITNDTIYCISFDVNMVHSVV